MEIDLATKQQLASLLANPGLVTQEHAPLLTELAKSFPVYRPLHLLLAKAGLPEDNRSHFAIASLTNGGKLLHQVLHQPETLRKTEIELVAQYNSRVETTDLVNHSIKTEQVIPEPDEQEVFEEIAEIDSSRSSAPAEEIPDSSEEIYDEITELNTAIYSTSDTIEDALPVKENAVQEEVLPDELAIESIVATDFFAFEKRFHAETDGDDKNSPIVFTQPEEYDQEAEAQTVSKYNDDKLPYTFLWWLAKTRKEHEQIFQPYVTPKKTAQQPNNELQQQYVEHIFHLQTPFNVADEAGKGPVKPAISHKGDDIIDNFIKNEPQIRTPKPEQLNNENKAKKSAEDHNDLVSETLAAIYIEQMLYHKAIETYEKLSLKFPEKSRYFADLIQSLEKKI